MYVQWSETDADGDGDGDGDVYGFASPWKRECILHSSSFKLLTYQTIE